MLKIFLLLFGVGYISSAQQDKSYSVSGQIIFEDQLKSGDIYLFVSSSGGSVVPLDFVSKDKIPDKKTPVAAPDLSNRWISIGRKSGNAMSFDISLSKGSYQLGCIVKRSKPDCTEVIYDKQKIIIRCFPGREDTLCDSLRIEVDNSNLYDLRLRGGVAEKEGA